MKTAVVIPAAGMGTRMGAVKQLMLLDNMPVLARTVSAFENHEDIDEIIISAPKNVADMLLSYNFKKIKAIVNGGANRQSSVWEGLKAVSADISNVLIHDGARPLISKQVISDIIECVSQSNCAVSGVKSKDTVKITNDEGIIQNTPSREQVWIVQTPQGFPISIIMRAHQQAIAENFVGTDDAMLVERLSIPVRMVNGDYKNIKLTTPEDIKLAEAFLQ